VELIRIENDLSNSSMKFTLPDVSSNHFLSLESRIRLFVKNFRGNFQILNLLRIDSFYISNLFIIIIIRLSIK